MPSGKPAASSPSREQILEFVRAQDGEISKRDIYRAFKVSAADKPSVRTLLKELADEGLIGRARKRRILPAGTLPPVLVAEIIDLNSDGEPVAQPAEWREDGPPPKIVIVANQSRGQSAPGIGDRALIRIRDNNEGQSESYHQAHIIRILDARPKRITGVFRDVHDGGRVIPTDRRARSEFHIPKGQTDNARAGDLVIIESRRGRWLGLPQAKVVERLGPFDGPQAVSALVLSRNNIPTEFPEPALRQAEEAKAPGLSGRVDLRELDLITIDDEDARDFDDAVWAEPDENNPGCWHAVVAIADVSHFVSADSPLDKEAFRRGNSVYLPDRVVPMLPEALSNGLCSLKPNEDRACLALHLNIDGEGKIELAKVERAIMRSTARLTYKQVQSCQDGYGDQATDLLKDTVIRPLYGVYKCLAEARRKRGVIDLDLPERRVRLAPDGSVASIETRPRFDSHRLIEELMIAANCAVAEALTAKNQPCMYRIHDQPSLDRLESLREFLSSFGYKLAKTNHILPIHFNQILSKAKTTPAYEAVSLAVLRAQSQAEYAPENIGHFGLNLRDYAHFTSPIRRYADLLVHRAIIRTFKLGTDGLKPDVAADFANIGQAISNTERRAADAERDAIDHFSARFMADQVGAEFIARITGVTRFGLFVTLPDSGASGLLPMRMLGERFNHDEDRQQLVAERSKTKYALGDTLPVVLAEADPITGSLRFDLQDGLVSKQSPLKRSSTKRPGSKRSRRKSKR